MDRLLQEENIITCSDSYEHPRQRIEEGDIISIANTKFRVVGPDFQSEEVTDVWSATQKIRIIPLPTPVRHVWREQLPSVLWSLLSLLVLLALSVLTLLWPFLPWT
jgi:hypothetical protein